MNLDLGGVSKDVLLDTTKVNDGVWVHLDSARIDEETGKHVPMYLGGDKSKPQRAKVRSYRCKAIKDAEAALQRQGMVKMRVARKKNRDEVIENTLLKDEERFSFFLVALENFGTAGGIQEVSQADAKALHGMTEFDDIVSQIRDIAYDDTYYLADESTPEGNAFAPQPTEKTGTGTEENQE